jgi:hypothetical protein
LFVSGRAMNEIEATLTRIEPYDGGFLESCGHRRCQGLAQSRIFSHNVDYRRPRTVGPVHHPVRAAHYWLDGSVPARIVFDERDVSFGAAP